MYCNKSKIRVFGQLKPTEEPLEVMFQRGTFEAQYSYKASDPQSTELCMIVRILTKHQLIKMYETLQYHAYRTLPMRWQVDERVPN